MAHEKFRVEYNVGVPGLHVAYNAFSEETERRIFNADIVYKFQSIGLILDPHNIPCCPMWPQSWQMYNLARECGLAKHMMLPDISSNNNYEVAQQYGESWPGGMPYHFDCNEQFGEYVVGVSLGRSCELRMLYDPEDTTEDWEGPEKLNVFATKDPEVYKRFERKYAKMAHPKGVGPLSIVLPRRSIYVLSGDARSKWKHAIYSVGKLPKRRIDAIFAGWGPLFAPALDPDAPPPLGPFDPAPAWNTTGARRSITLRSSKMFEIACLQRKIDAARASGDKTALQIAQARLELQEDQHKRNHVRVAIYNEKVPFMHPLINEEKEIEAAKAKVRRLHELFAATVDRLNAIKLCELRIPGGEMLPNVLERMDPKVRIIYEDSFASLSAEQKLQYLEKHGTFAQLFGSGGGSSSRAGAGNSTAAALNLQTPNKNEKYAAGASGSGSGKKNGESDGPSGSGAGSGSDSQEEDLEEELIEQAKRESLEECKSVDEKEVEEAMKLSLLEAAQEEALRKQEEEETQQAIAASKADMGGRSVYKRKRDEEAGEGPSKW